jgi:uncharacterized protein (TIRG00374 family)
MSDVTDDPSPRTTLERQRGSLGVIVAAAAVGYVVYALWHDLPATATELAGFNWPLYAPILALTLVNYGLRFAKWHWLLLRLGVEVPMAANALTFTAGLGMVITPGKAGELIKPWLVREMTGAPMIRTVPALVVERMTDGIAVVVLAAFGVATFLPDSTALILGTLVATCVGVVVLASEVLGTALTSAMAAIPVLSGLAAKLDDALRALRTCLSPWALVVTLAASLVAWWAECVGYWLVFRGLGASAGLDVSTFLYAFATVFGAPSPGGMGMADAALVEGAIQLVPNLAASTAFAAALLVRVATLWFGVVLGAAVMLRLDAVIAMGRRA